MAEDNRVLLEVEELKKYFPVKAGALRRVVGYVHAVDGVSFSICSGQTLGLVGESGSGKSTTANLILRLIEPDDGRLFFDGNDVLNVSPGKMRKLRKDMQIVFQDPYASLSPKMRVEAILEEPMRIHREGTPEYRRKRIKELIEVVGLKRGDLYRFPHEFSGGQQQRIGIARALALNPKFVILDEPVSALDVSIQAQIINLLIDLQKQFNLTYLFVSHDLSVVRHISDQVAVMYLGKIVEICDSERLYEDPAHPYTQALLSAVPVPDPSRGKKKQRYLLRGEISSTINPPSGCRFHARCAIAKERCKTEEPSLTPLDRNGNHMVSCWYPSVRIVDYKGAGKNSVRQDI